MVAPTLPISAPLALVAGIALVGIARWAARRRGTRWDALVALRLGDVLITEVVGVFLIGYGVGTLVIPPEPGPGPASAPRVAGRFAAVTNPRNLPLTLGLVTAVVDVLAHVDLRGVFLGGHSTRNALASYFGWETSVIAAIPAGGIGQITVRDGLGNMVPIIATADVDIPVGTRVRVVGARHLTLVVAPLARPPGTRPASA